MALLTTDQSSLQTSIREFFAAESDLGYVRKRIGVKAADVALWQKLVALGVPALWEADSAAGVRSLTLVAFEAGRALVPLGLSEALLFGPLLETLVSAEEREALRNVPDLSPQALTSGAVRVGCAQGFCVTQRFVADGDAVQFVATLKKSCLEISPVVSATWHESLDLSVPFSRVELGQPALRLSAETSQSVLCLYQLFKAAEIAGACGRVVEMTVEYVKTRKQFGVPIATFQAVSHRVADMFLWSEAMESLCLFAGWAADCSPRQLALAATSALRFASDTGPRCVEAAIQAHGGIGFTWEHDLHLFLRRVRSIVALHAPSPESVVDCAAALNAG